MALFKKLFGKSEDKNTPKGFASVKVLSRETVTDDMVKITFDTGEEKDKYKFVPGQYITLCIYIGGEELRRSYSICSAENEPLSVAVKKVDGGKVSNWVFDSLNEGDDILISKPEGGFTLQPEHKNVVAIAAGSGITPIMSIARAIEKRGGNCQLFFGNRFAASVPFKEDLDGLKNTSVHYYLSGEEKEGFTHGRITKDELSSLVKKDLSLLKYDAYFLCGPEQMIHDAESVLKLFGVSEDKIRYELFTPPVIYKKEVKGDSEFHGTSHVKVIIDDEVSEFDLKGDGESILEKANAMDLDAPYSCKGGVCSTCRAKVLKGNARMTINYALTDDEVSEGFILTCQAHPTSEEIVISYDE